MANCMTSELFRTLSAKKSSLLGFGGPRRGREQPSKLVMFLYRERQPV